MADVEPVSWENLDLDEGVRRTFVKKAASAPQQGASSILSFDLDGSLALAARLEKAAEAKDEDEGGGSAPPWLAKKDEKKDEPPPAKKKADDDEPDQDEGGQDKVAALAGAAVIRQTFSEICDVLAGYEPQLDKTAGLIGVGLLEGHSQQAIEGFLEKVAIGPFGPLRDLPEAGLLTSARRVFHRTPAERELQATANQARAQHKASEYARNLEVNERAMYANQAAAHAKSDAVNRMAELSNLEAGGLSRLQAEKVLADRAAKANAAALRTARQAHGLDKGTIRLGIGGLETGVNSRLFKRTIPMMAAPFVAGALLGRRSNDERERPRSIVIQ